MEQEVVLDVKVKNQTLKQQLREAVKEAQALQEQFGATSQQAINAAKKVANIKEEISDMNDVFKAFNPESKFNAVIGVTQGIAGGFQAVTGAMQLFGTESEEVEKALLKVQAASALAEGLNNIKGLGDAFSNMKLVVLDAVKSLGAMKTALLATGIGAITVAVGLLITNWDKLKAAITGVTKEQQIYKDAQEEVNKKVADATAQIDQMKVTMDAAKNGTIDKKTALEEYNNTLGETLGKATSYEEAEKRLVAYEASYIKSVEKRAQAQIFFAKSAELAAKAASGEDVDPTTWQSIGNFITSLGNPLDFVQKQAESISDNFKDLKDKADLYSKEAQKAMTEALAEEKKIDAKGQNEKIEADKKKKEDAKKAHDALLKEQEEFNNKRSALLMDLIKDEEEKLYAQQDKELQDIQKQYAKKEKQRKELETLLSEKYKILFAELKEKERLQAIEQAEKDRQLAEQQLQEKQAFDLMMLETELTNLKTRGELTTAEEIRLENEKYEILKANKNLGYAETEKLKADHEAKIKEINDKATNDAIAARQRERDAILQLSQETLNGLISLAEIGIKNEKKMEQFRKAAALVQIGIDTAKAISSAVAAASATSITPVDLAIKIAASIATVLANIAKAKQLLSASSSGSTPSLSSQAATTSSTASTTAGGVTGMQAPQQVGQGIANANAINNALNNPNMIRAVVVETDITDSQRRVRGIEERATFG